MRGGQRDANTRTTQNNPCMAGQTQAKDIQVSGMTSLNIQGEIEKLFDKYRNADLEGSLDEYRLMPKLLALFTTELEKARMGELDWAWENSHELWVDGVEVPRQLSAFNKKVAERIHGIKALSAGNET